MAKPKKDGPVYLGEALEDAWALLTDVDGKLEGRLPPGKDKSEIVAKAKKMLNELERLGEYDTHCLPIMELYRLVIALAE